MDQRFLDEAVSRRPELFQAMIELNRSFLRRDVSAHVHSQSLPHETPLLDALCQDRTFLHSLSSSARGENKGESYRGWWDFSDESMRLVLMSERELRHLGLCFSAAVFAEEIARIIDREQVLQLRTALGPEIISYALKRGRYQIGSLRQSIAEQMEPAPLLQRIESLASAVIPLIAQGWPEELRLLWEGRMATASSRSDTAVSTTALPQLSREQRRTLWFTLKKILLQEAAKKWAPCFD